MMTEFRLPEGVLGGTWLVDTESVNLHDLKDCRPGGIIRMRHADAVRYVPRLIDDYGFVAGMISDAA